MLGPNSWLWLGAIISSSFIIFLIIIGIITRYHIFPIDHNTNAIFSDPLRAFLNMLVICVSIAVVSSVSVLWNKQNAKEAKQIQSVEGSSPTVSPTSMIYNASHQFYSYPLAFFFYEANIVITKA
jgi:ferric-chelate reductase